jgi:hypothetical protein
MAQRNKHTAPTTTDSADKPASKRGKGTNLLDD